MKEQIEKIFQEKFNRQPKFIVRSPGRINIIGEHTDYNKGFVLPAAIDKAAWLALAPREDSLLKIYAADLQESFEGDASQPDRLEPMHWPNYLLGVMQQFRKRGYSGRGMDLVLLSEVPIGAGLSSSAAIECAMAFALNELYGAQLERMELVKMAQKAEHEYAGVLCGIMDQFASMMGKAHHAIRLDCDSLEYDYVPLQLEGYRFLLLNTNVKHSLASSEYNTRRQECERGVELVKKKYPQVSSLRDVTPAMLAETVAGEDALVYKRCSYIVEEIIRLQEACQDLHAGNLAALGQKMLATHRGLSEDYAVSCRELDWLVDFVKDRPGLLGARMMGGGFGGCTINLVAKDAIENLISTITPAYESAMQLPLTAYIVNVDDGTRFV
jgi:galactokinase